MSDKMDEIERLDEEMKAKGLYGSAFHLTLRARLVMRKRLEEFDVSRQEAERIVSLHPKDSPFQKLFRDKTKKGELPLWFNPENLHIFNDK